MGQASPPNGDSDRDVDCSPPRTAFRRGQALLLDRWNIQLQAYTCYRYSLVDPFLIAGPANFLNIGTGGGVETLRLLRKGNYVTTIERDEPTANRTRERICRSGFADRHTGHCGHVLEIPISTTFHGILMTEVLEHIQEDFRTINRLAAWLVPGGRLILSTPTAAYGQLPGDTISLQEDGGHVRVGYDGPELDEMLRSAGLITLHRVYNGHRLVRLQHRIERKLSIAQSLQPLRLAFSLVSRPLMPLLDLFPGRPLSQITLAMKQRATRTAG